MLLGRTKFLSIPEADTVAVASLVIGVPCVLLANALEFCNLHRAAMVFGVISGVAIVLLISSLTVIWRK